MCKYEKHFHPNHNSYLPIIQTVNSLASNLLSLGIYGFGHYYVPLHFFLLVFLWLSILLSIVWSFQPSYYNFAIFASFSFYHIYPIFFQLRAGSTIHFLLTLRWLPPRSSHDLPILMAPLPFLSTGYFSLPTISGLLRTFPEDLFFYLFK